MIIITLLQILSITNNVVTIGSWSRCLCTQSLGVTDIALKLSPIYMNLGSAESVKNLGQNWLSFASQILLTQFCITDFVKYFRQLLCTESCEQFDTDSVNWELWSIWHKNYLIHWLVEAFCWNTQMMFNFRNCLTLWKLSFLL